MNVNYKEVFTVHYVDKDKFQEFLNGQHPKGHRLIAFQIDPTTGQFVAVYLERVLEVTSPTMPPELEEVAVPQADGVSN
jgi:hypothetical protein